VIGLDFIFYLFIIFFLPCSVFRKRSPVARSCASWSSEATVYRNFLLASVRWRVWSPLTCPRTTWASEYCRGKDWIPGTSSLTQYHGLQILIVKKKRSELGQGTISNAYKALPIQKTY
jgi:hypothetical protein